MFLRDHQITNMEEHRLDSLWIKDPKGALGT